MRKLTILILLALFVNRVAAQSPSSASNNPFLFSVNTLTSNTQKWNLNYSGSYGQRVSGPFGYDGLDQRLAVKGYLGNRFTLYGSAALGFGNGGVRSAQQVEILKDVLGGQKNFGPRLGFGLGVNRDWDGVGGIVSRLIASIDSKKWRLGGNLIFEKAFSTNRDHIDFTTSFGVQHKFGNNLYVGLEGVGQDLEGFWDKNEAEGGAKLLLGPSLNYSPLDKKLGFSIAGGPVFYATKSNILVSNAIRDITTESGFTVRAMLTYNLVK